MIPHAVMLSAAKHLSVKLRLLAALLRFRAKRDAISIRNTALDFTRRLYCARFSGGNASAKIPTPSSPPWLY
jgi:hypothetical protein